MERRWQGKGLPSHHCPVCVWDRFRPVYQRKLQAMVRLGASLFYKAVAQLPSCFLSDHRGSELKREFCPKKNPSLLFFLVWFWKTNQLDMCVLKQVFK